MTQTRSSKKSLFPHSTPTARKQPKTPSHLGT